jgi:hypothetical protein
LIWLVFVAMQILLSILVEGDGTVVEEYDKVCIMTGVRERWVFCYLEGGFFTSHCLGLF